MSTQLSVLRQLVRAAESQPDPTPELRAAIERFHATRARHLASRHPGGRRRPIDTDWVYQQIAGRDRTLADVARELNVRPGTLSQRLSEKAYVED